MTSRAATALWIVLALTASVSDAAARDAAVSHRGRHAQPTPLSQASQDRTATIAARDEAASSVAVDEPLPPLFNLPSAPRSRMRACGEKWQAMKLGGAAGNEIWRDFADKCLAAKD